LVRHPWRNPRFPRSDVRISWLDVCTFPCKLRGMHTKRKRVAWAHLPVDRPHQILADGVISDDWDPDLGINGAP